LLASELALSAVTDAKPILVERQRSRRPLAVYLMPVSPTVVAPHDFLTHARVIVLVTDPEAGGPPDPSIIRDVMGLTLSEARIASLIGSGLPPREAAAKLGIAEETARKALKQVFTKVGVSRQSELAALMTKFVLVAAENAD
jgi:DNA-binding CsgD family transcriptional regulator